jgi:hypothetical protein
MCGSSHSPRRTARDIPEIAGEPGISSMRAGGPEPRFDRVMYRPRRSSTLHKSLAITLSTAALIVVLALAILGVLTAVAGQQSGLDRSDCARTGCEAPLNR